MRFQEFPKNAVWERRREAKQPSNEAGHYAAEDLTGVVCLPAAVKKSTLANVSKDAQ